MASLLSFSALIEAISRAVAQAQDEVEKHQVRNLLDYFDRNNRPRSIPFRVPSRRADARPGEEDFYTVPLLTLVSINVLKIKDVQIKFAVDMGELSDEPAAAGPAKPALQQAMGAPAAPMKVLSVSTATGRGGGKVQVTLRVKGSEPSEGAARLLDYLAQIQGVYPEIIEPPAEGEPPKPP
jgi:hypothetical protein